MYWLPQRNSDASALGAPFVGLLVDVDRGNGCQPPQEARVLRAPVNQRGSLHLMTSSDEKKPESAQPNPEANEAEDPDRAAILARRQRFIAIALSGLAVGAEAGCDSVPQPCLSIAPPQQNDNVQAEQKPVPRPCLKIAVPRPQKPVEETQTSTKAGSATAPAETKKASTKKNTTVRPESRKVRPQPCLRVRVNPSKPERKGE